MILSSQLCVHGISAFLLISFQQQQQNLFYLLYWSVMPTAFMTNLYDQFPTILWLLQSNVSNQRNHFKFLEISDVDDTTIGL